VPENGTASHFDHRLGAKLRLFPQTGTQTTAQDYDFHRKELLHEGDKQTIIPYGPDNGQTSGERKLVSFVVFDLAH
jgi:hypothetical protein